MDDESFQDTPVSCFAWQVVPGHAVVYIELSVGRVKIDGSVTYGSNEQMVVSSDGTTVQLFRGAECTVWWKGNTRYIEVEGCSNC